MDDSTSPLLTATYTKLDGTTATDNTAIDVNKYVAHHHAGGQ
jgi:hypothetical protein